MQFLTELLNLLLRPEVLTLFSAILVAAITWLLNEASKRKHNDYIRKEERYAALLDNLKGFYVGTQSKQQKDEFIRELNRCWLYCPDIVIEKGYAFLEKVHTDKKYSDEAKELSVGEFIIEIRRDLLPKRFGVLKRTSLNASDFKHLTST